MDWWDNTWLIEGFATYMAVKSVTAAEPDWQLVLYHSRHFSTVQYLL
jgi:aminopeptidase N